MRQHGTGSVDQLPSGRWRARLFVAGSRRALGTYASQDEADAVLAGALAVLDEQEHRDGVTLAVWGEAALDRRERQGLRGVDRERSRWATHVARSDLADLPVSSIVRADVQRWLDRLMVTRARGPRGGTTIARQTASNTLSLLRIVLEDAVARGVATTNPAAGVKLPRGRGRTHDAWTYLELGEQRRLVAAAPAHARPTVAFAIHAGLRQGEQWALELADVHLEAHVPHVWVRYGGPNRAPTKNGRPRRVDLLPGAVDALRAQLELVEHLTSSESRKGKPWNPLGLVFPTLRGTMRQPGAPAGWESWVERAKLGRTVRWHDLRHTCASSLVAGWWGRAWTLTEVCALLGHSSIKVTERYAHLAGSITQDAVSATKGAAHAKARDGLHRSDSYRVESQAPGQPPLGRSVQDAGGSGGRLGLRHGSADEEDRREQDAAVERARHLLHQARDAARWGDQDRFHAEPASAHAHDAGDERGRADAARHDARDQEDGVRTPPPVRLGADSRGVVPGHTGVGRLRDQSQRSRIPGKPRKSLSHLGDLNPRPTVYEGVGVPSESAGMGAISGHAWPVVTHERAIALLNSIASGDVHAAMRAVELAEAVLEGAARSGPTLRAVDGGAA